MLVGGTSVPVPKVVALSQGVVVQRWRLRPFLRLPISLVRSGG
jgi:hypothetical protein